MGKPIIAIYSGSIPSTPFIENLIKGLARLEVIIYLFGNCVNNFSYLHENIRIYSSPKNGYEKYAFTFYQFIYASLFNVKKLKRLLNEADKNKGWRNLVHWLAKTLPVINHLPDIFHIQWAHSVNEWLWLQNFNVRIVCSLRGGQINYSPICNQNIEDRYVKCFPKMDAFHAVSHAIAIEAQKYGADPTRIKVVYSGIDLEKIDKIKAKNQPEKTSFIQINETTPNINRHGRINIISVGRFHWKKGYKYALDACKILKAGGIDFHYYIVAKGEATEYQMQVSDLGLDEQVSIIPELTHEKVIEIVDEMDIFLLPSVEEGIANVVLEAMSAETFLISTDCGGMKEVIEEDITGFIVPVRSAQAIADSIIRFRDISINKKQKMVERGRGTIENRFGLSRLGEEMYELYGKV